jgi:hypothetical protein
MLIEICHSLLKTDFTINKTIKQSKGISIVNRIEGIEDVQQGTTPLE